MKVDLHLHSKYSWDSLVPIEAYISLAEERNFGAISISDHNNAESHEDIKELQKTTKVILIPGQEVSTSDGHLLVYGWLPTLPMKKTMKETVELARELGGENKVICVAAHPFDRLRGGKGKVIFTADIDGMEILNASTLVGVFNWIAKRNSMKHPVFTVANSDSHRASEFGTAYSEIPDSNTIEEVLDNLKFAKVRGKKIGVIKKANRYFRRKFGKMTE